MIDRDYAHHFQLSADWTIEGEGQEGSHTVDIYDPDIWTITDAFVKFVAAEFEFPREVVVGRIIEHLSERG